MNQNIYNCKKYAVLYRLVCSIEKKSETISNRYGACLDKLTPTGLVERVAVTSRYLQSLIKQKQSIGTEIHVEA